MALVDCSRCQKRYGRRPRDYPISDECIDCLDKANPEKKPIRECITCGTLYDPVEELVGWNRDKSERECPRCGGEDTGWVTIVLHRFGSGRQFLSLSEVERREKWPSKIDIQRLKSKKE